ncbi:outer dense fiber protein 4 [Petaurus breviceps papuanus]|uniref:outer dense fiber protein 4 n=1 Tax=Petaurus breviceps papuanus TaxID=3040969 RepID=UPI0036DAB9C8
MTPFSEQPIRNCICWLSRVEGAELSLTAFIVQMITTFSQQWVYISKETFYEAILKNEPKNRNYSFRGLWDHCTIRDCANNSSFEEKNSFYKLLEMAETNFLISLGSLLFLTIWFHRVFSHLVKNFQFFHWNGGFRNLFIACFVLFTPILFPVYIWLQEMNMKNRLMLGRSYYLGRLVLLIYIPCAILCFRNNRDSCRVCPQPQSQTNSFQLHYEEENLNVFSTLEPA